MYTILEKVVAIKRHRQYTEDNLKAKIRELTANGRDFEEEIEDLKTNLARLEKHNKLLTTENGKLSSKAKEAMSERMREHERSIEHFQVYNTNIVHGCFFCYR